MGLSVKYAIKLLRSRTGSVPYSRTRHKSTLSSPVPTSKIISLKSLSILVFLIPNKIIAKIPKNISIHFGDSVNLTPLRQAVTFS